jgi:hypothetical protein
MYDFHCSYFILTDCQRKQVHNNFAKQVFDWLKCQYFSIKPFTLLADTNDHLTHRLYRRGVYHIALTLRLHQSVKVLRLVNKIF